MSNFCVLHEEENILVSRRTSEGEQIWCLDVDEAKMVARAARCMDTTQNYVILQFIDVDIDGD